MADNSCDDAAVDQSDLINAANPLDPIIDAVIAAQKRAADPESLLQEAQGALGQVLHLSTLIRAAAEEIADTCYAYQDDVIRALNDGAAIREAVEIVREKTQLALDHITEISCARREAEEA
jgi:hypothetical protein